MSFFYNILMLIYIPIFSVITKKKGYSIDFKERFVLYKKSKKETVWFHCASVGELNIAKPVIREISKRYNVLITVFSPRGKEHGKKTFPEAEIKMLPFDISFLIKRFLEKNNVKAVFIVEGELWYNLIKESSKRIPVVSINTRISPKSFKLYKRFGFFFKRILNRFSLFIARSKTDEKFLKEFVTEKSKIVLCGDLKLFSSIPEKNVKLKIKSRKVIVAGSTHHPEEEILIGIYKKLKKGIKDLTLIIAPRHLERIGDVISTVKKHGLTYSLRTETDKVEKDIYIIDTIGELSGIYRYADVVFVGGTVAPVGGHNILEPALLNKPVVIGKHYEKIKDMFELLNKKEAVFCAKDETELEKYLKKALEGSVKTDIDLRKQSEEIFNCYIKNVNKILEKAWKK